MNQALIKKVIPAAGIVLILAGLSRFYLLASLDLAGTVLLGAGTVALVTALIFNFDVWQEIVFRRSIRHSANALLGALLVLGILVLINFMAGAHTFRLDLTAAKQFSLSEQTRKVLQNLIGDLEVRAFYKPEERQDLEDLLKEYAHETPHFRYEFVDPDRQPALAKKYGITSYRTTVLEYNGKTEKITGETEQDLTNAIVKITRSRQKKIYFATGHGEKMISDTERSGMSQATELLKEKNYLAEELLLLNQDTIAADCAVLVIAGPQKAFLQKELDMLERYLANGGAVLMMLDPPPNPSFSNFLQDWGLQAEEVIAVDASGLGMLFGAGATMPVAAEYNLLHPITESFGNFMTAFPLARSIAIADSTAEGVEVHWLAKTTQNSWGEKDLKAEEVAFDEGVDVPGPLTVAAVASRTVSADDTTDASNGDAEKKKGKIALFGDSDFASNAFLHFQANSDLFLNTVSWLAEEEDLISIRPRNPEDRRLNLTSMQSRLLLLFGVIMLPLAVLSVAVVVYRRRI